MISNLMDKYPDEIYENSEISDALINESQATLEVELEMESHPEEVAEEFGEETPYIKTSKAIREETIRLLEAGAETFHDFEVIVEFYDRITAALERRARYHEIGRDDVPLEYNMAPDPVIFPVQSAYWKNATSGNYLDIIYDCPFEIHQLVSNELVSNALRELKAEQKEIIHYKKVRCFRSEDIAAMRGQSRQNVNKVYKTAIGKVRKNMEKESKREYEHDTRSHFFSMETLQFVSDKDKQRRNKICDCI